MFRISVLLFFFCISLNTYAQTKQYSTYKIQPKDTWTKLSGIYGVSIEELQKANPGITTLKIGATISVPSGSGVAAGENTYHTVQKGETLYRISKMYNQTIDDIKRWNHLTSNNVGLGQKLIVSKSVKPKPVESISTADAVITHDPAQDEMMTKAEVSNPEPDTKSEPLADVADAAPVKADVIKPANDSPGNIAVDDPMVEKITETGVATWLDDEALNQNKFYALHRTAPIGTIIKVINRMNNNAVFVKVVGVLPDTGDNENTIIKITKAAAQRIGALDQRFTAELSYGLTQQ